MSVDEAELGALARRAAGGDRAALEQVMAAVRDDVFHLARRMLGDTEDARDATQEILVKVMTNLGAWRADSALRTWVYRVAANTLVSMKRGRREVFSFEMMEGFIEQGLGSGLPAPPSADVHVLREEVMVGCTQGALMSLDRDQRIVFTLCELFDLTSDQAAEVLEIDAAAVRKRLQRARERLTAFMQKKCGLVDPGNPCRCEKMIGPSVAAGLLDPARLRYDAHAHRLQRKDPEIEAHLSELKELHARVRAVLRTHPKDGLPAEAAEALRSLLATPEMFKTPQ